jgi:hypothetical protein
MAHELDGGVNFMTRLQSNGERISALCAGEEPPAGFNWQQEPHHILEVCNRWRVHARWWAGDQAVWREYFKVTTDSGLLCLIYHDLQSGEWFLSRIYD